MNKMCKICFFTKNKLIEESRAHTLYKGHRGHRGGTEVRGDTKGLTSFGIKLMPW